MKWTHAGVRFQTGVKLHGVYIIISLHLPSSLRQLSRKTKKYIKNKYQLSFSVNHKSSMSKHVICIIEIIELQKLCFSQFLLDTLIPSLNSLIKIQNNFNCMYSFQIPNKKICLGCEQIRSGKNQKQDILLYFLA